MHSPSLFRRLVLVLLACAAWMTLTPLSPANASLTAQDPWATDALQFTDYLQKMQVFSSNITPGVSVPASTQTGRAARRAYAALQEQATKKNTKAAKRTINDLNTIRDRAIRDSQLSRDNRTTTIQNAYDSAARALDYKRDSNAATRDTEYELALLKAQSDLDSALNANETGYRNTVISTNNAFGTHRGRASRQRRRDQ
jgi:hypothetical protein